MEQDRDDGGGRDKQLLSGVQVAFEEAPVSTLSVKALP